MWTLHKMCCRKLLKYTELIIITNKLQAFVKECRQTTEMILLDKKGTPKYLLWCINFLSHPLSQPGSLCLLSAFLFLLSLSFSLNFFTLSNLCFYLPLSAYHRLFGSSCFHSLSPLTNAPCPSLSLPFLSLLCSVSWNNCCNVKKDLSQTYHLMQYCGLMRGIFSPHVSCLSKYSVMKPVVTDILNLQESQKQVFLSNYLH